MFARLTYLILFILVSITVTGQGILTGKVTSDDGSPLVGVNIIKSDGTKFLGNTDEGGNYSIEIESDQDIEIRFSYVGYDNRKYTVNVASGDAQTLNVVLKLKTSGVIKIEAYNDREGPIKKIPVKVTTGIPSITGGIEAILRIAPVNMSNELSSAYSVRGGSFDENLVYVNDIQVYRPFLVRSGQQEGLSFPNPDMVDNILFSAGGFEAKYGDKMSSVLDITYKNPESFEGAFTASFLGGAIQFGDRYQVGKDDGEQGYISVNTGVRYKSNAYVLGSLDTQGEYNPNFLDFQSYVTWKPRKFGIAEYSFLGNISRNNYNFTPITRQTDVGTINEALRFTVAFQGEEQSAFETYFGAFSSKFFTSDNSFLRFTVSAFQTYENENFDILGEYRLDELERDFGSDEFGEVLRNRGIGAFREHARNALDARVLNFAHKGGSELSRNNYLEWGARFQSEAIKDRLSEWKLIDSSGYASPRPPDNVGYIDIEDRPDQEIQMTDLIKSNNDITSYRINLYAQNKREWENTEEEKFTLTYGLRGTFWSYNNELVGGPRAQLAYTPNWVKTVDSVEVKRDLVFTFSGGFYYQPAFYKELRGLDGTLNPDIKAQQAIHAVAGIDYVYEMWDRDFNLRGEIYYKDLNNLIPYEVENVRTRYYATNNSNGYAAGIDIMLNGEFIEGVQSWFRASLLKTEEDLTDDSYIENINTDGKVIVPGFTLNDTIVASNLVNPGFIPRPTDQRFSFSMIFQDQMKKWPDYKVLVSMFYSTGLPYGPPTFERYLDVLRLPAYRRVDIGFSKDFFTNRKKEDPFIKSGWLSLEVFNILAINNTNNYTWVEDVNGRQYGIANFLTGRRLNLKIHFDF